MITNEQWQIAQGHEKNYWGNCQNTFGEEVKQLIYADRMGLVVYDNGISSFTLNANNQKILDIGGGPVSMLLKTVNLGEGTVVDPCEYPLWVVARYKEANINYYRLPAEGLPEMKEKFDEVWIYNCLQHTIDPEKIVKNAKQVGKLIRLFEWIDHPTNAMHPHMLTEENLNKWLGAKGNVEDIDEQGCVGKCYSGVFKEK